jgi:hypothetical protein
MKEIYLENFTSRGDVIRAFEIEAKDIKGCDILLAWYGYGSYDGDAFVLFDRDGVLYEVNGSHCSCYGLEGQWDPEETTVGSLRFRMEKGSLGCDDYSGGGVFRDDLKAAIKRWERRHNEK